MKNFKANLKIPAATFAILVFWSCSNPASPILLDDSELRRRSTEPLPCETEGEACESPSPSGSVPLPTVDPSFTPPPAGLSCKLTASIKKVEKGKSVLFTIQADSGIASAKIDGKSVTNLAALSRSIVMENSRAVPAEVVGQNGQSANCEPVDIEVVPPPPKPLPTCELKATKTAIEYGEDITLTFTTTNATSGYVDNTDIKTNTKTLKGSQVVSPAVTYTYTGHVTGAGGTNICELPISVNTGDATGGGVPEPPGCNSFVSPGTLVTPGTTVTYTINAGATSKFISFGTEKIFAKSVTRSFIINDKFTIVAGSNNTYGSSNCSRVINVVRPVKLCNPGGNCYCSGTDVFYNYQKTREYGADTCRYQSFSNGLSCTHNSLGACLYCGLICRSN